MQRVKVRKVDTVFRKLLQVHAHVARAAGRRGGGGGLGYRIRETLLTSGFEQRFCSKGRFSSLMASLPVKLITHPQPGLLGAAAAFAQTYLDQPKP